MADDIHIDVGDWLNTIGLRCDDYLVIFGRFIGVESLLHLTEQDILDLGVDSAAHRAKIITSLIVIRAQLEKRLGLKTTTPAVTNGDQKLRSQTEHVHYEGPDYAPLNVASPLPVVPEKMSLVRSPSFNIDNHPWYHSQISRQAAEALVKNDGDFLVRNSISNPGDYVLSCRWRGQSLHFMINKQIESTGKYSKYKYQFEDALFDTVPGLVNFYVTCKCAISQRSGAVITKPIRRGEVADPLHRPLPLPPTPEYNLDRTESMPATPRRNFLESIDMNKKMQRAESESNIRHQSTEHSHLTRSSPQRVLKKSKPMIPIKNKALYEDDGKDYSDYSQVKSTPAIILEARKRRELGLTSPLHDTSKFQFLTSPNSDGYGKMISQNDMFYSMKKVTNMKLPIMDEKSLIKAEEFNTNFMALDSKPLETPAILAIKTVLLNHSPMTLARHMTKIDLDMFNIVRKEDMGVCVSSGLEHITLPQGCQLRQDVLERYHSMRMFIVLTILTCPQLPERSLMLQRWIDVATELKNKMGNLFALSVIMESLAHPSITRLRSTWLQVHQQYTQTLFILKTKLRPFMSSLHDGTAQLPLQNISIPYIIPLCEILERHPLEAQPSAWETEDLSCLDTILLHLDTARVITSQVGIYVAKGEEILDEFTPDSEVLDVFRTEMHQKLCWGSRGVSVGREERLIKFNQLLAVLSERSDPSPETNV